MANKGQKGQIKGQTVLKLDCHIFLTCMGLFECARPDFGTVLKFLDQRGQKGHSVLAGRLSKTTDFDEKGLK